MLASSLLGIKGLGKVRLNNLSVRYSTLEEILKASDADLAAITKLPPASLIELREKVTKLIQGHHLKDTLSSPDSESAPTSAQASTSASTPTSS
jgi:hypothetical protein